MNPVPYKATPVFDQDTLPDAIRTEHRTKEGTWGLLRVLEGSATLVFIEPPRETTVAIDSPGQIPPQEPHFVRVEGPVRLQIEFYHELPLGGANGRAQRN